MAKYKILDTCWLDFKESGPRLVEPYTEVMLEGDKREMIPTVIDYAGWPNSVMEPVDDEAKENAEAVARLKPNNSLPRSPAEWRRTMAK